MLSLDTAYDLNPTLRTVFQKITVKLNRFLPLMKYRDTDFRT